MPDELITPAIAAAQLHTTPQTICRWCRSHGIGRRVGRNIVLTESDVETLRGLVRVVAGNPGFGTEWKGRGGRSK